MPPPGGRAHDRRRSHPAQFTPTSAVRVYLAAMVLLTMVFFAVPGLRTVTWGLIGLGGVLAFVAGIAIYRPAARTAWLLLGGSVAVFAGTDLAENVQDTNAFNGSSFPSPADGVALLAYPLAAAGFWLFIRRQRSTRDWAGLIDALTVTTGAALLAWSFLIWPTVHEHDRTWVSRAVSICYPLGDVLLLAVLARLINGARTRPASAWLLTVGALGLLTSDALFELDILHTAWRAGSFTSAGWLVFYIGWGMAALHPSMTRVGERGPYRVAGISRAGLALLTVASLVSPGVLLIASLYGDVREASVLAAFAGVSSILVLARLAVAIRSYRRTVAREQALRAVGEVLVAATSVEEVTGAVELAGTMLLSSDSAGWLALRTGPVAVRGPGPTPLVFPLTIERPEGRRATDAAIIAAGPEEELAALLDTLEILAGQAALALARVLLGQEIRRRDNEAYFRTLVHNATDVILIVGDDARIRYASPSADQLFAAGELAGMALDHLVGRGRVEKIRSLLSGLESGPADWVIEAGGGEIAVEVRSDDLRADETVGGVVLTLRDVTEQRRLEGELRHHAYHDPLTGLANRRRVQDRIDQAIARVHASGRVAALLLLDLDDFKDVNDTKGHGVGDELLVEVAERLRAGLRPDDVAARLGGDEFAVLLPDVPRPGDADALAERLNRAFDPPFALADGPVPIAASIGVATTAEAGTSEELLRNADLALYAAKADGKRRWRHYEPGLHDKAVERSGLRASLARAIADDAMTLHYQPVVELGDGRLRGFEALARWPHPARGVIDPGVFIPLAEETGQIMPLGRLLLRHAVAEAAEWNRARAAADLPGAVMRVPPLSIAVNASIQQFRDPRFAEETIALLEAAALPADLLTLELTESDLMHHHDEQARKTLNVLKDHGVRIAIDDFGTGYSSLSYLRDLPIDTLKIDRSFIADITASLEQAALVEGIIRIADALGLHVVAEGVETQAQWDLLGATDCDYGQGYLFGRPMSGDQVAELLAGHRDPRLPLPAGDPR